MTNFIWPNQDALSAHTISKLLRPGSGFSFWSNTEDRSLSGALDKMAYQQVDFSVERNTDL